MLAEMSETRDAIGIAKVPYSHSHCGGSLVGGGVAKKGQ